MKTYIKITHGILATLLVPILMVSCSEDDMDSVNKDINHTVDVPAKFIMADVITSTAFSNAGGDLNTYTACYVEHETGTFNQLWRAEIREGEPSSASTFNNVWDNLYTALKNSRLVIEKCSEGGSQAGNQITKGVAEVMAAYNSALIADMFGNAPWSEAALPLSEAGVPEYMTPKIDTQESIYAGIMTYLDNAIADLQGVDAHLSKGMGQYDLLYAGDAAKWLKFAYGLKARYTMHLLKRAANATTALEDVVKYADLSFTSADDQAAYAHYDANNLNPLFDFQWSRDGIAASKSMADKLIERNDPRLRRIFFYSSNNDNWGLQITGAEDELFKMAPNGEPEQSQAYYNYSMFSYAQTTPTLLLSYHEVLFLKAEALSRLNRVSEAESVLKDAFVAAIANAEIGVSAAINAPTVGGLTETTSPITALEAGKYFDTTIKPLFDSNSLKEVMTQKYLAFFGASGESTECYNDIRRMKALGEDFVTLKNPNDFPLRCPYGNDDTLANPNVKEAFGDGQYVYSEPVWWAGGTR